MSVIIPVILCGGSGTRLWPLSRHGRPKQFISLTGDYTLLDATLLRAKKIAGARDPICVTAVNYGTEIRRSLDRLGIRGTLLLEPESRNTAPALTVAALVALRRDANAIIVALPADHIIEDSLDFSTSIEFACAAAERGWLVILGVKPRHPSDALGYIMPAAGLEGVPEVWRVGRFIEKPARAAARGLIDVGALWNAGIVVARADQVVAAMQKHEPTILAAVERSLGASLVATDEVTLDASEFLAAPKISFDQAVLERHEAVAVALLNADWRDVGTWAEVEQLYPADPDGNRVSGSGHLSASKGSFLFSPRRLAVGIGLTDLVIVDTPDALLVANRNELQRLRGAVEELTAGTAPGAAAEPRFASADLAESVADDDPRTFCIWLNPGETTFPEPYRDVSRHLIVVEGAVRVTIKDQIQIYDVNQSFHVAPGETCTIANTGQTRAKLIEVHLKVRS